MLVPDPALDFEPSKTTKMLWRYVRKTRTTFSGVTLPGLFQISYFPLDMLAFFTVIGLEFWGLANLLRLGVLFRFTAFLFMLDVALAILRHIPEGAICLLENKLVVSESAAEQERIRKKATYLKLLSRFFSLLILIVALFKVYSFWGLQAEGFNGLTAGILVSYLLVATLHITTTGYFFFGTVTALFFWIDRSTSLREPPNRSVRIGGELEHGIRSKVRLFPAIADGIHRLVATEEKPQTADDEPEYSYELRTHGLLTDQQRDALIGQQKDGEAKRIVAMEVLRHQLYMLDKDPYSGSGTTPGEELFSGKTVPLTRKSSGGPLQFGWLGLLMAVTTMVGCVSAPQKSTDQTFPLTILVSSPHAAVPDDLISMCLPLLGSRCDRVFYPQVTIERTDLLPEGRLELPGSIPSRVSAAVQKDRSESAAGRVKKFWGQEPSIQEKSAYVRRGLEQDERIGAFLSASQNVQAEPSPAPSMDVILQRHSGRQMFLLDPKGNATAIKGAATTATSEEALVEAIGAYLCGIADSLAAIEGSMDLPGVVIVYRPGALTEHAEPSKQQSIESNSVKHTSPDGSSESFAGPDKGLRELLERSRPCVDALVQSLPCANAERLSNEFAQAEIKYGRDYRFPYEHAKLLVLGRHRHDPAFVRLYDAAERAIAAGRSAEMLQRLRKDAAVSGPFEKLADGHEEWHTLEQALIDSDQDAVGRGLGARDHDEHGRDG